MAIRPEKKEVALREKVKKLADFLENQIDNQLENFPEKNPVGCPYIILKKYFDICLLQNPLVEKEIKRRYIENGWKNIRFEWVESTTSNREYGKLYIYFDESI